MITGPDLTAQRRDGRAAFICRVGDGGDWGRWQQGRSSIPPCPGPRADTRRAANIARYRRDYYPS